MKTIFLKSSLIALSLAATLVSCGSDDNTAILEQPPVVDPGTKIATIDLSADAENVVTGTFFAEASGVADSTIPASVKFASLGKKMDRLYITETLPGGTPMPFVIPADDKITKRLTKPDGSIDLDKANKESFEFFFDLKVPSEMADGQIVYNFWATSGKGDFRNTDKRLQVGVGTIVVKIGTGVNPNAQLLSFPGIKLFAPDSEGKTKAFFSLLNGEAFAPIVVASGVEIAQGPELRNLWDFGYYYTTNAAISSTKDYTNNFPFNVEGFTPTATENFDNQEILNEAFFSVSSKDFDASLIASDLDDIVTPTANQITNLKVGDVIEFVDNYKNKGLIRVVQIEPGFDNDDFIIIDVKVQPSAPVMSK